MTTADIALILYVAIGAIYFGYLVSITKDDDPAKEKSVAIVAIAVFWPVSVLACIGIKIGAATKGRPT